MSEPAHRTERVTTGAGNGAPLRALIIEDSEDDARLLIRQLIRSGYELEVERVETAAEMSRLLDERDWDVIIADYFLPHFTALRALDVLHEKELDIPFLIFSGTVGEETAVEAMRAGAHDYIMKGSSARLIPAIERELREAKERATRRQAEQALRAHELRFRSLIEHSSDITTIVDLRGTIMYASPSAGRILGVPPEELAGSALRKHVHSDDIDALLWAIADGTGETSCEFRVVAQDGGWRTLEAAMNRLLDDPNVGGVVLNCRDVTARKRDEATIRHLAYFDALTGLPNRMLFNDRLAQALAHAKRRGVPGVAILFSDIDRFKTINDTLGHGAGDELLRVTAKRFAQAIREEDTVARLGGDEFLFLLPGVVDVENAARVAQKILDLFSNPFEILGHELHVSTSIGISMFPSDGTDGETLIRNADTALYRAKEGGRNRYQLYAPAMNAIALERLMMENALRRALERAELTLHYQPLVSLVDGRIAGLEALVRWKHPEQGLVPVGDFIPMAEETGLIVPITQWVLSAACRQMKEWQREGIAPDSVSVNVSARRFNDCGLPSIVARALEGTGLEGRHLSIELTESVMMEDVEETIGTLRSLKDLGVSISIDDFGTGYSSLSYLKRLPIDTLKIDQSFVRHIPNDADDAAISMLIIAMAHSLKLSVVAEGVETEEQRSFLRSHQCDLVQGFLVSRPLTADGTAEFLRNGRNRTQ